MNMVILSIIAWEQESATLGRAKGNNENVEHLRCSLSASQLIHETNESVGELAIPFRFHKFKSEREQRDGLKNTECGRSIGPWHDDVNNI